jgi:hypothetical protein
VGKLKHAPRVGARTGGKKWELFPGCHNLSDMPVVFLLKHHTVVTGPSGPEGTNVSLFEQRAGAKFRRAKHPTVLANSGSSSRSIA